MGDRWNRAQVEPLAWMVVLAEERPACFRQDAWELFLTGVQAEAMGDKAMRRRLERGWMPRYCESCTPEHRAVMAAAGQCQPLPGFEHG